MARTRYTKQNIEELIDNNPRVRAFLDTLSMSEGTYGKGDNGYDIVYGGKTLAEYGGNYDRHLGKYFRINNKTDKKTSAAGRYQFIKGTWEGKAKQLGLSDFSPRNQDIAAVSLAIDRGMLPAILDGDVATWRMKGKDEWASLGPSAAGKKYGNQKYHSQDKISKYYNDALALQNNKIDNQPVLVDNQQEQIDNQQMIVDSGNTPDLLKQQDNVSYNNENLALNEANQIQNNEQLVADSSLISNEQNLQITPEQLLSFIDKQDNNNSFEGEESVQQITANNEQLANEQLANEQLADNQLYNDLYNNFEADEDEDTQYLSTEDNDYMQAEFSRFDGMMSKQRQEIDSLTAQLANKIKQVVNLKV